MILNTDKTSERGDESPVELSEAAMDVLYGVAANLGFLTTQDESDALTEFFDRMEALGGAAVLTEVQSVVRLNRQAKMDQLTMRSALVIAQHKNDPLFKKYAQASQIRLKLRGMIASKYHTQSMATARQLLANAGKRNMVDVSHSAAYNRRQNHGNQPMPRDGGRRSGPSASVPHTAAAGPTVVARPGGTGPKT